MKRILGIDDAEEIHLFLSHILAHDYDYSGTSETEGIIEKAISLSPMLILLDINLGKTTGFDIYKQILQNNELNKTPVIFMSERTEGKDKLKAFRLGAQDYITKPLDEDELIARIEKRILDSAKEFENEVLTSGNLSLDLSTHKLLIDHRDSTKLVELTSLEFRLLHYFMKNANRIVTREQILNHVWNNELGISERVVDVHISTLKKKSEDLKRRLRSIYGSGYELKD